MVRVLAMMILSHVTKASTSDCDQVGRALIKNFYFSKNMRVICICSKICNIQCQNCNRKTPSPAGESEPKPKQVKTEPQKHSYPSLAGEPEDKTTHSQNKKLLQDEIGKLKPSNTNAKKLMTHTFLNRREWHGF